MAKLSKEDFEGLTGRQKLRFIQRQRETRIFSGLTVGMAILLVFGALIGYGVIPVPFLNGFSEKVVYVSAGKTPCPPDGLVLSKPSDIKAAVMNGTDRPGLAAMAADSLKALGVEVTGIGNHTTDQVLGTAEISAPLTMLPQAFALAALIPESEVVVSSRTKEDIQVILGQDFESVVDKDAVSVLLDAPVSPSEDCLPIDPQVKVPLKVQDQSQPESEKSDSNK